MLIYEFRVILPMSVEEYQVAQLFSVAEASKNETGGGDGIEVVENHPYTPESLIENKPSPVFHADGNSYDHGQYTHKIYHLYSKVPGFVRLLAPKGSLDVTEKAWNAYPYCRTCITNDEYMKKNFHLNIITYHKAGKGELENVHNLSAEQLAKRKVVWIDIANDEVSTSDYKEDEDPKKYHSDKADRGPLTTNWKDTANPIMCAYKLVVCEFKWFGLQNRVESFIMRTEKRLFTNFHRLMFCSMDKWFGLTMTDIREIEEKTKEDLDVMRKRGSVRGMKEN